MKDKNKAIAIAAGALALGGIAYAIYKATRKPNLPPSCEDVNGVPYYWNGVACVPVDGPLECAVGYHPNADNTGCIPNEVPVGETIPINIYYMKQITENLNPWGIWGVIAGWQTCDTNFDHGIFTPFLPITATWEVDGVPIVGIPTCDNINFDTVKVTLTDGVVTGSKTITPDDITENYGVMPSNVTGQTAQVYGTGKLSGIRIYNTSLTPEYGYISFLNDAYPNATWWADNCWKMYGFGTGNLDYHVWLVSILSLLEEYWRTMNAGETYGEFACAGWTDLSGYKIWNSNNPTDPKIRLALFIFNTSYRLANSFEYGQSILWNRYLDADGSQDKPWIWDDGWKGAGYYLGAPGSFYGTATYIAVEW
jgi:hypothetical protein